MGIEITWTITAIIAVSSFLSPIFVALINNRHHTCIRKMELEHDALLRKLDLQRQADIRQTDIYYSDKKQAFSEFAVAAGNFAKSRSNHLMYEALQASANRALLFCNPNNQKQLCNFLNYVDIEVVGQESGRVLACDYSKALTSVVLSLNQELESTKPVINCE